MYLGWLNNICLYYNIVCLLYIIYNTISVLLLYSIVGTSCVCVRALTFWIVNDYNNLCLNPDLV